MNFKKNDSLLRRGSFNLGGQIDLKSYFKKNNTFKTNNLNKKGLGASNGTASLWIGSSAQVVVKSEEQFKLFT